MHHSSAQSYPLSKVRSLFYHQNSSFLEEAIILNGFFKILFIPSILLIPLEIIYFLELLLGFL